MFPPKEVSPIKIRFYTAEIDLETSALTVSGYLYDTRDREVEDFGPFQIKIASDVDEEIQKMEAENGGVLEEAFLNTYKRAQRQFVPKFKGAMPLPKVRELESGEYEVSYPI
jgi:hypothetical protein